MFETITLEVVGGLITAVILTFLGFFYGRYFEKEKYKKRYDPALSNFSTNLGEAIMNAQRNTSIEEARIIVSIRDSTRQQLTNVSELLNSDIDKLKDLIQQADRFVTSGEPVPQRISAQIAETIRVLKGTWPSKRSQIDVALRKLLVELGLVEAT